MRDTDLMTRELRALGTRDGDGDGGRRVEPAPFVAPAQIDYGLAGNVMRFAPLGGRVEIDAAASSQFVSALLLAGARYDRGVEVVQTGPLVPSCPHLKMTLAMLRDHGVQVEHPQENLWRVTPGSIAALDEPIEPDLSNAAPFLADAAVTAGSVTVPGWPHPTEQRTTMASWRRRSLRSPRWPTRRAGFEASPTCADTSPTASRRSRAN